MRKYILTLYISLICFQVVAQQPRFIFPEAADSITVNSTSNKLDSVGLKKDSVQSPSIYAWKIIPRFGDRIMVDRDTLHYDFHAKSLIDNRDVAVGYLGSIGTPALSKIYFNRPDKSQFSFLDAFDYYRKNPEDNLFLNTKEPYSRLYYQSAGGGQNKEEELKVELSMNFGKKINIGVNLDYLYARGFYQNSANKQFNYDVYGSYIDEKFEIQAFVANNYFNNAENGGILDVGLLGATPSVPPYEMNVALNNVWNKLNGRHIYLSGKYNLATQEETGVPVASLIYTTHYTDQRRSFLAKNPKVDPSFFNPEELHGDINELFAYWSFKNTFAIALNEGFKDWVKFGLKAFIEQDIRKYAYPVAIYPFMNNREGQSETRIGGLLSKKQGLYLNYDISADIAVTGYNLGEFNIVGSASTNVPLKGKNASLTAKGYIKNIKPTFFENSPAFYPIHYKYDLNGVYLPTSVVNNNFKNTRKVYVGGELNIPHTGTILTGGVENVENLIYADGTKTLKQNGGNVQIVTIGGEQRLKAGILHWNNQVVFQASSNEDVLPLPTLSVYSNIYIEAVLAKVLKLQLGFDVRYHTEYYAPGYNPLTIQFYNQKEVKIGNFPITTAYANLHLQKTRFFFMMYNVTGRMGNAQYLSLPHYPVNPMVFKFGISWDFAN